MTHEEIRENVSAFFDGELDDRQAAEIRAHLENCAECRRYLEELRAASGALKKEGRAKLPFAVRAAVLAEAASEKANKRRYMPAASRFLAVACCAIVLALLMGLLARIYLPTLFGQMQGLIGGAVGSLGSSSGGN